MVAKAGACRDGLGSVSYNASPGARAQFDRLPAGEAGVGLRDRPLLQLLEECRRLVVRLGVELLAHAVGESPVDA